MPVASGWEKQAESLTDERSLRAFIAESQSILDQLATAASERFQFALSETDTAESQKMRDAYLLWLERYTLIETGEKESDHVAEKRRQQVFVEQVGYMYFVRLVLTHILEDKEILFLPLTCRYFFQQPVFDWFLPDDYLLALVLHRLGKYNFKDVTSDLLGFTYETFIDRVARNKKGHFLTPPAVVEFMLDRAGYSDSAIIGESFIDTACGSGSFLVHAARRLRDALATATKDPLILARLFIEQVQTRLVGLEVNPFSCYLAEINLFIQLLDDLLLLWQNGENLNIERFAIYNTNSLEMPQAVLHSERNNTAATFLDEAATLDEAAPVKAKPSSFTYVICNPPYVNRGIILGTKSYGKFPFYREVVKGDENSYLLFLRLASYYVSPGGTVCFICPLNLLGDESTMYTRELFGGTEWTIQAITRLYARDVLFPGVLQGVCIIRLDNLPSQPLDTVEIRGGHSIEEAAQATATQVQRARITNNYPVKTTWSKPWLVNANPATYDIWEFVRASTQQDFTDLTQGKLEVRKGDVRSTWAKPMLVPHSGKKFVPLTKGKDIVDWDSWSVSAYLDPSVTIPSSVKDYSSCLWVQRQAQRIIELTQSETVLFLKEVSGLEMKRPIRGTIIQRDGQNPIVADETILVMYTLRPAHEHLAYALFGLLTSSTYNFLFSLFSTNAHANFKEILRLPVPLWIPSREQQLANETRNLLRIYQDVHDHEKKYGTDQTRHVSINHILTATKLPSLRLEELVLRGDITIHGAPNYTLEVMLNRGQLTFHPTLNPSAINTVERFVHANGTLTYSKGGKNIPVPNPGVAAAFLSQLEEFERERTTKVQAVVDAQQALDNLVLDAYGITFSSWREVIAMGVPWAKN